MNGYPRIGGVDGGECDAPFKITFPEDARRLKARVDAMMRSTDLDVRACAHLSAGEQQSWSLFYREWQLFAAEDVGTFGSHGTWVTACTYAHTLDAWRDLLKKKCHLSAPTDIPGALSSGTKWLIGGLAVAGVVGALLYFGPTVKAVAGVRK